MEILDQLEVVVSNNKRYPKFFKQPDINDSCSDAFVFSSEIIGMSVEIVNAIDFAISSTYLVDSGFCTG